VNQNVTLTPEQFAELLDVASGKRQAQAGLGAAVAGGRGGQSKGARVLGLGFGAGSLGPMATSVYEYLAAGYPRLALAKAYGIPFAPYIVNVRATFPDTSTADIPDVGSDVKITQDTVMDAMVYRIFNESTTANQNAFQAESDWYYNWQSGIEATLDVQGAPRYAVAPRFTPLSNLLDAFNGDSHVGAGWVLTYTQQLIMSFTAKVTVPFAPIEVVCSFRGWQPVWDELVQMTNREALHRLADDCGLDIDEAYAGRCCR